jgi:hypothetical protein
MRVRSPLLMERACPENREAGGEAKMHYKTYKLRKRMIRKHISGWWENYFFAKGYVKMVAKQKIRKRKHFRKIG